MTLNVTAICANCDRKQPLDAHARCSVCGSDSVVYPKPRDARASMGRAMYAMAQEAIAKMES